MFYYIATLYVHIENKIVHNNCKFLSFNYYFYRIYFISFCISYKHEVRFLIQIFIYFLCIFSPDDGPEKA